MTEELVARVNDWELMCG